MLSLELQAEHDRIMALMRVRIDRHVAHLNRCYAQMKRRQRERDEAVEWFRALHPGAENITLIRIGRP